MRIIDADELKKAIAEKFDDFIPEGVYDEIDNVPTISEGLYEAYCRMNDAELEHTERLSFSNSKGEIVGFVKERPQGEWVRKEDVIHSIAKQYSEHNELVPIWLSIGDMKGDAG